MHNETVPVVTPKPSPELCSCEHPLPREQAEWKGASRTTCERCTLPIPLRLSAA